MRTMSARTYLNWRLERFLPCVGWAWARGILQALLDLCRARYSGVSLSVRLDNPAVRLYERLGFRRTSASPIINRVGTESIVMLLSFRQRGHRQRSGVE